jgi:hypothetical protein
MNGAHEEGIFRLDCGEEVALQAFYCHETYGGYLEGRLECINQAILSKVPTCMNRLWGPRKTILIPLPEDEFLGQLPKWQVHVWLESQSPINDDDDGSELVAVFFRHSVLDVNLNSLVFEAVRSIDWRAEAQGFSY